MQKKERKVSDCKSRRLTPKIIKLINDGKTYKQIEKKLGISKATVKRVAMDNNLEVVDSRTLRAKFSRNEELKELLDIGMTYEEAAEKMGITKQRVYQIAKKNGIRRWEETRQEHETWINVIKADIEVGLTYYELIDKHSITPKEMARLRYYGLGNIFTDFLKERNQKVVKEYKNRIAKDIVAKHSPSLDNPLPISNINQVYRISSNLGYRKYPNIGNRSAGGVFEDQDVIMIIKVKREVDELSFQKIADLLNEKGYTTPMGKPYQSANVRAKYLGIKKHKI